MIWLTYMVINDYHLKLNENLSSIEKKEILENISLQ